jgi:Ca2+-binding RTX toxin-like protein
MATIFGRNRFPDLFVGTEEGDHLYGYSETEGRWTDTGGDVLEGRGGEDFLAGGFGRDTLRGGDENDTLDGGPGGDELDGGWGIDTATYWFSTAPVYINLLEGEGYSGEADGDTFIEVENVIGSGWDDVIVGDNHGNRIEGWFGHDTLVGLGGSDWLFGGDGVDLLYGGDHGDFLQGGDHDDHLWGGAGADRLSGDEGADTYFYTRVSDSPVPGRLPGTYDQIFFDEGDTINLSGIDANTTADGNQAFTWIDGPSYSGAGQLRMQIVGKSWHVLGETTGDGRADFMLSVSIGAFDAGDVIL